MFGRKGKTLNDIVTTLKNHRANMGYDETADPDGLVEPEVENLTGLITFLEGC